MLLLLLGLLLLGELLGLLSLSLGFLLAGNLLLLELMELGLSSELLFVGVLGLLLLLND